jgi:hypothetical protein
MTANTPSTRKAKGRALQNFVHDNILSSFPELEGGDVKKAIMGESGIDIKLSPHARRIFPYGIECKNIEKINIWAAINQCELNTDKENENSNTKLMPLLVIKRNRTDIHVVLKWEDFIKLVTKPIQTM